MKLFYTLGYLFLNNKINIKQSINIITCYIMFIKKYY
jgi:hypothetical protein